MPTRELRVQFLGDERDLKRALRSTGTTISPLERRFGAFGKTASNTFSRIGSAARRATPYIAGGFAVGLGLAVKEGIEAEKVGNQTTAVIKSTGGAARVSSKHLADYANKLSLVSGVDDEVIQSGGNLLLTFTNIRNEAGRGNKVFDSTLKVANDMSAALGQDMKASAIQLGKALNDPTTGLTALRRVGVSFSTQQTERIQKWYEEGKVVKAQKAILAELTKEFGGSAAAQATGLDRLKVAAENVAESIGLKILPTLERIGDEAAGILSSDKLTGGQKSSAMIDLISRELGRGIDTLVGLAPQAAAAGAKLGGQAALGFGKAFVNSDILGKLFIAGAALRTFGGPGVFSAMGKGAGRRFALGFIAAIELIELGKQIKLAIEGEKLDAPVSEELAHKLNEGLGSAVKGIAIGKAGVTLRTALGRLIFNPQTGEVIKASSKRLRSLVGKSADDAISILKEKFGGQGGTRDAARDWASGLDKFRMLAHSKLGQVLGITKQDLHTIRQAVSAGMDWRAVVKGRLDSYVAQIRDAMSRGQISVKKGTALINSILRQEGAILGPAAGTGGALGGKGGKGGGGGGGGTFAAGGVVVPGLGSGDVVPLHIAGRLAAMVEPGELVSVANRSATKALMGINSDVPRGPARLAGGGVLPSFSPTDSGLISATSVAALNLEKAWAERVLRKLAQTPRGGGASFGPDGIGHYKGLPMANWVIESLQHAARKGAAPAPTSGYRSHATNVAAGRYYHSEHEGTQYPHGAVDFGGYSTGLAAKMSVVNATRDFKFPLLAPIGFHDDGHASGTGHRLGGILRLAQGGGVPPPKHGGHWIKDLGGRVDANEGATLLWQAGLSEAQAGLLSKVLPTESGGDPRSVNPTSGATGLWQILGRARGGPPGSLFDPRINSIHAAIKFAEGGLGPWEGAASGPTGHVLRDRVAGKAGGGGAGGGNNGKPPAKPIPMTLLGRQHRELAGPAGHAADAGVKAARQAMHAARGTDTVADDIAALQQFRTARASEKELAKARKRWQWAKRHGTKEQKRTALQNLLALEQGLTTPAAAGEAADTTTDTSAADLQQSIDDHLAEVAEELKALRASIDEQNKIAGSELAIGLAEARKAFADILSGELGGRVTARGHTAGAGSVVRS